MCYNTHTSAITWTLALGYIVWVPDVNIYPIFYSVWLLFSKKSINPLFYYPIDCINVLAIVFCVYYETLPNKS